MHRFNNSQENFVARVVVFAALIAFVAVIFAQKTTDADHGPVWQEPNTIQNIYENRIAWQEYTDANDETMVAALDAGDRTYAAELAGDSLSVTMSFIQNTNRATLGSTRKTVLSRLATAAIVECNDVMWYANEVIGEGYAMFYAGFYYNLTSNVGDPIELDWLHEKTREGVDYSLDAIPNRCFREIDR
jgi:hypothetical protein